MAARTRASKNNAALAEEFAVLRTRKVWTYEELERRSGIKAAQCERLLRNQATFDVDDILALSAAFRESPADMLDRAVANVLAKKRDGR